MLRVSLRLNADADFISIEYQSKAFSFRKIQFLIKKKTLNRKVKILILTTLIFHFGICHKTDECKNIR